MKYSEYKDFLRCELYNNKKVSFTQKLRAKYFTQSTNCMYLCRKMWYLNSGGPIKKALSLLYKQRILHRFGCSISATAKVGKGFYIPHPVGIVIGFCKIGENCKIFQNSTIGVKHSGEDPKILFPTIGDNVTIFAGSIIVGDISICDNTIIGANSFVNKSIKEVGVYAGNPAQKIKDRNQT